MWTGVELQQRSAGDQVFVPALPGREHKRDIGHLFGQNVARIAFKRGAYLRNFVYAFAEMTSDRLTRPLVERAMAGDAYDYQL